MTILGRLWSNWITLLGSAITSVSALAILIALGINMTTTLNPYVVGAFFLVMPPAFLLGLVLIPIGLYRERRRHRASAEASHPVEEAFARFIENPVFRKRLAFFGLVSALNILILATVTHAAVTFMDSPKFCGTVCHSVMQPEYEAHERSPHSHVACVSCHIGNTAAGLVEAKLSGLRRVWAVMRGNHSRPIATPVHGLPVASDTCESCHKPRQVRGERLGLRVHFKDDQANTPQITAMVFHMGGGAPASKQAGIHNHVGGRFQIRYEALDHKRQVIGRIQKMENGRVVAEWLPPEGHRGPAVESRVMDCIDCHNRPTHIYDGTPASAIDKAFTEGLLDRGVPWLRQMGVAALIGAPPAAATAEARFRKALDEGYGRAHPAEKPAAAQLDAAAHGLAALDRRNVYPQMKITWNSYPSNIGHGGADPGGSKVGCFRCHSGDHRTADGRELTSKCEGCHEVLLKDELAEDLPDEIRPLVRY